MREATGATGCRQAGFGAAAWPVPKKWRCGAYAGAAIEEGKQCGVSSNAAVRGETRIKAGRGARMIRWVLTIFVGLIVLSAFLPWLEKLGLGRLPGDIRFSLFGRNIFLPFASTVLLTVVIFLAARLLR